MKRTRIVIFCMLAAAAAAREEDAGSCTGRGGVSADGQCLADKETNRGDDSSDSDTDSDSSSSVNDSEPRTCELATDCATSDYLRSIHGRETWHFLRDMYVASGGRPDGRRDDVPHGFNVEFEVRDDGPRGRSVYAAADIPEGTRVYRGDHMVIFRSPTELVSFLKLLPHDLQCDVLLWAFSGFDGHVYLDMDEGSYINHGEMEDIITLDYNADTTREVRKGEEFLQDYGEYVAPLRSKWFNIIRGRAWKEGDGESNVGDYISTGAPEKQMHSSGR